MAALGFSRKFPIKVRDLIVADQNPPHESARDQVMDQAGLLVAVVFPGPDTIELQVAAQLCNLPVIVPGFGVLSVVHVALVSDDHPAGSGARFQQQPGLFQSAPVGGVGGDGTARTPAGHGRGNVNRFLAGAHQRAGPDLDSSSPDIGEPLSPAASRIFHPLGDLPDEQLGHLSGAVGLDPQPYRPGMLGRQGLAPESRGGNDMHLGPPGQIHQQLRIPTHPDGSAFHDGSGAVFIGERLVKGVQHPRGLSQHSFPQGAQGSGRGCVKLGPIHRGRMFVHEGRSQPFGVDRSEHRLHGRGPVRSFWRRAGPKQQGRPGSHSRTGQKLPPAEVAFICERHRFHRLPGLQSDLVRGNPHPSNLVGPGRDHPTPKSCPRRCFHSRVGVFAPTGSPAGAALVSPTSLKRGVIRILVQAATSLPP